MRMVASALVCLALAQAAAAEPIKIGIVHNSAQAPFYLALDKGYFAAEALEASLVPFDAAQPVAVAVVSGDVDFGAVAATGGFYSLAGQGALKIIGGETHEAPGFQLFGFVVSSGAYAAGLTSVKGLPAIPCGDAGRVGLSLRAVASRREIRGGPQIDSPPAAAIDPQYCLGADRQPGGFGDAQRHRVGAAAARGAARSSSPGRATRRLIRRRCSSRLEQDRRRQARHDRAASSAPTARARTIITTPSPPRAVPAPTVPTAGEVAAVIAKHTGLTPEQVRLGIGYDEYRREARREGHFAPGRVVRSQGLVKGEFDPQSVIDTRYAKPLPEPRS